MTRNLAAGIALAAIVAIAAPRGTADHGNTRPVVGQPSLGASQNVGANGSGEHKAGAAELPTIGYGEASPATESGAPTPSRNVLEAASATAQPATVKPSPAPSIGTALVGGVATWYRDANQPASALYAAVPWWRHHPVTIRVCAAECVVVTAIDFCACGDRDGMMTVADLSPAAFSRLAPLSAGVVQVTVEWPLSLPNTDTGGKP